MKLVAVIPARAGSKGLPGKNRRSLGGKWLVSHAVDFAYSTGVFEKIIVTTDDDKIRQKFPDISSIRPEELAHDETKTLDVLVDLVQREKLVSYDTLVLLEPTAPFRKKCDFTKGLILFGRKGVDSVISLSAVGDHHPIRMKRLTKSGLVLPYSEKEPEGLRRQEQSPVYIRNGSFYIIRVNNLLAPSPSIYGENSYGIICDDASTSVNIDTYYDLLLARIILKKSLRRNVGKTLD